MWAYFDGAHLRQRLMYNDATHRWMVAVHLQRTTQNNDVEKTRDLPRLMVWIKLNK